MLCAQLAARGILQQKQARSTVTESAAAFEPMQLQLGLQGIEPQSFQGLGGVIPRPWGCHTAPMRWPRLAQLLQAVLALAAQTAAPLMQ